MEQIHKNLIQYIPYQEIDKAKWDNCISKSPNGLLFAYSWYLDAVCDKWNALVYKNYEAVMPITVKSKLGISYFFNPIFAPQLGVFFSNKISDKILHEMISAIPGSIKLIDICLNSENKIEGLADYKVTQKHCQYIDLNISFESIKSGYSSNLIRNLKKAEKNNLELKINSEVKNVITLFKKGKGGKLEEMKPKTFLHLEKLLKAIIKNKSGKIYNAYFENQLIASACFAWSNNRIIYIKGGSTELGREKGAMHFIMDAVIKEFSNTEKVFDFGGSNITEVARFNKNFGSSDYVYSCLKKNSLPSYIKWLKK
jgi:hypothetical protein